LTTKGEIVLDPFVESGSAELRFDRGNDRRGRVTSGEVKVERVVIALQECVSVRLAELKAE
jgi:hypothetical protein